MMIFELGGNKNGEFLNIGKKQRRKQREMVRKE
jgi:hypothetical protein